MDASKIIDEIGGTSVVARLCDLTDGAVSQWRKNGIPKPWMKFLQRERPDAFDGMQEIDVGAGSV